jgi:hypothetical protein
MDSNTMQLAVIADPEEAESGEPLHQRWHLFSSRTPKKHRIQDLVARLRGDLKRSQDLNEELGGMLKDALEKNVDLQEQMAELTEKLRVAEEANRVNDMSVDFNFSPRRIDGPADQATMPVPVVEMQKLMDEPSVVAVAANAATALLERVVPKTTQQPQLVPAYAPMAVESDPDLDEAEVYNETSNGWNVRRPQVPVPPVTWGGKVASSRTLRTNMSSTGTFSVVSLQQRGTGPTAIPGLTG